MESDWMKCFAKSGELMFYYNKVTTEHRWPDIHNDSKLGALINQQPVEYKCTIDVGVQTEYIGCSSECTSAMIDGHKKLPLNKSVELSTSMVGQGPAVCKKGQSSLVTHTDSESCEMERVIESHLMQPLSELDPSDTASRKDPVESNSVDTDPQRNDCTVMADKNNNVYGEILQGEYMSANQGPISQNHDLNTICTQNNDNLVLKQVFDKKVNGLGKKPLICQFCRTTFKCMCREFSSQMKHLIIQVPVSSFKQSPDSFQILETCSNNEKDIQTDYTALTNTGIDSVDSNKKQNCTGLATIQFQEKMTAQKLNDSGSSTCSEKAKIGFQSLHVHGPSTSNNLVVSNKKGNDAEVTKTKTTSQKLSFPLKCPWCPKTFRFSFALHRHKFIHTGEPYKCKNCGKTFIQQASLHRHEQAQTCVRPLNYKEYSMDVLSKNPTTTKNPGENALSKEPITTKNPDQDSNEGEISMEVENKFPSQKYSQKTLKCSFCEKLFAFPFEVKRHERSHSSEKPYLCKICGKAYKHKGHAYSHEIVAHKKGKEKQKVIKPYPCQTCGTAFKELFHLKSHELTVHFDLKQHKCEICGKSFSRPYSLKRHQLHHNNKQFYHCEGCGKAYNSEKNLTNHLRQSDKCFTKSPNVQFVETKDYPMMKL